jgi:hypothetical protein
VKRRVLQKLFLQHLSAYTVIPAKAGIQSITNIAAESRSHTSCLGVAESEARWPFGPLALESRTSFQENFVPLSSVFEVLNSQFEIVLSSDLIPYTLYP